MSKHCSNFTCESSPTTRIEWRDSEGRKCFANYCDSHAMQAKEKQERTGKQPTLEDLLKETN